MVYDLLKRNKLIINFLIILSFIFLAFFSGVLLLKNHSLSVTGDMTFHFRRIMELRTSFMHNDFLPNFALNKYYGSAVMLFYPYLNLYPIVILSFFIKSKITLIYVFFMFNTFITFIISFYSCKNYIKNYSTSYIFSIIYGLSNVFFAHNFINMDYGIVSSYIFLPLIIFSFMSIIKGKNNWLELSLGMTLVAFSHILSVMMFTILLIIWLIVNPKKINKSLVVKLCKSIVLFLILTSIIYLPFLNFYIHNNLSSIRMPYSIQLIRSGIKPFLAGVYGEINIESMNGFALITLIISIFFYRNFDSLIKQMYFLSLGIVILVLVFPSGLTSHGIFKSLNMFQFTWRLYVIPNILLIFIFSLIITKYIHEYRRRNLLCIITIIIAILLQFLGQYSFINTYSYKYPINIQNDYETSNPSKYKISNSIQLMGLVDNNYEKNDDYIPKKALSISKYVNSHNGLINNTKTIPVEHVGYNTFHFKGEKEMNEISLPLYMYNNEKVNVYLNNEPVSYFMNNKGLLSIDDINYKTNKDNKDNKVYIKPTLDKYRIIGLILFIIGLIFSLILIFLK